jgi:hypothetical protein
MSKAAEQDNCGLAGGDKFLFSRQAAGNQAENNNTLCRHRRA